MNKKQLKTLFQSLFLTISILGVFMTSSATASSIIKKPIAARYQTATFAGGCFWCTESNLEQLPGVIEVISGYSDGESKNPNYEQVSSGRTKHVEAVKVRFDASKISYDELLAEFWRIIDPTDAGGSFVDRGYQYHSAIFYHDKQQQQQAEKSKQLLADSGIFKQPIVTEIKPLKNFYAAEDYHQDYYKKSSIKYKYYRYRSGRDQFIEKTWGDKKINWDELSSKQTKSVAAASSAKTAVASSTNKVEDIDTRMKNYVKPTKEDLLHTLTAIQYAVTQENNTERAFKNEFHDKKDPGLYVDIVSGEVLFSSKDKYDSKTGWPSFTHPIDDKMIKAVEEKTLFTRRIEIRSAIADSHLGHVFSDGPQPRGLRFCMNSASLKFIPLEKMEELGYGAYMKYVR